MNGWDWLVIALYLAGLLALALMSPAPSATLPAEPADNSASWKHTYGFVVCHFALLIGACAALQHWLGS